MEYVQTLLGRIDLNSIAGVNVALKDPRGLFAGLVVVVAVLYGLSVGKTKALVSLLAVYVAYMLTVLFPFMPWLQAQVVLPETTPVLALGLFLVLYIVTFLLLSHSMMKHRLTLGEISLVKVVLISVVQLGLLSSIAISLLPSDFAAKSFGPAYSYLAGSRALWAWAVASLLIMPFMRHRNRD